MSKNSSNGHYVDNQALPDLSALFARLNPQAVEQFYNNYHRWMLQQQMDAMQLQIDALLQQITANTDLMQQVQPSAIALASLAQLQSCGVADIDLLDRMLARGDTWLDYAMQLLERCERLDVIGGNYTEWCEHALEGAYDWITSMQESATEDAADVADVISDTASSGTSLSVSEPAIQATEELLLQKLMSEEEETQKLPMISSKDSLAAPGNDALPSPRITQPLDALASSSLSPARITRPLHELSFEHSLATLSDNEQPSSRITRPLTAPSESDLPSEDANNEPASEAIFTTLANSELPSESALVISSNDELPSEPALTVPSDDELPSESALTIPSASIASEISQEASETAISPVDTPAPAGTSTSADTPIETPLFSQPTDIFSSADVSEQIDASTDRPDHTRSADAADHIDIFTDVSEQIDALIIEDVPDAEDIPSISADTFTAGDIPASREASSPQSVPDAEETFLMEDTPGLQDTQPMKILPASRRSRARIDNSGSVDKEIVALPASSIDTTVPVSEDIAPASSATTDEAAPITNKENAITAEELQPASISPEAIPELEATSQDGAELPVSVETGLAIPTISSVSIPTTPAIFSPVEEPEKVAEVAPILDRPEPVTERTKIVHQTSGPLRNEPDHSIASRPMSETTTAYGDSSALPVSSTSSATSVERPQTPIAPPTILSFGSTGSTQHDDHALPSIDDAAHRQPSASGPGRQDEPLIDAVAHQQPQTPLFRWQDEPPADMQALPELPRKRGLLSSLLRFLAKLWR